VNEHKQSRNDRFWAWVERNKGKILVVETVIIVSSIAKPAVRREIAGYRLMQERVAETSRLVNAMAFGDELKDAIT
jgi:hypothetical protein